MCRLTRQKSHLAVAYCDHLNCGSIQAARRLPEVGTPTTRASGTAQTDRTEKYSRRCPLWSPELWIHPGSPKATWSGYADNQGKWQMRRQDGKVIEQKQLGPTECKSRQTARSYLAEARRLLDYSALRPGSATAHHPHNHINSRLTEGMFMAGTMCVFVFVPEVPTTKLRH